MLMIERWGVQMLKYLEGGAGLVTESLASVVRHVW